MCCKLTLIYGLVCDFCSSGQSFAHQGTFQPLKSGFFQIPPHDGHPCLWLNLPATGRLRDFHPTERALTTCAHRAHSKRRRLVRVSAWCLLAPKDLACQSLASYNAHGVRLPSARRNVLSHCRATSGSCVTITTALCSS